MTREELKEHCKKQIEMCEMWATAKGEKPCDKVYEEHKLILELLEQQPKVGHWIPVSERLPEESGRYLISVLDGVGRRTTVAPYQPRYKAWTMTGRMAYWKVIAWMPLPEPYEPQESE